MIPTRSIRIGVLADFDRSKAKQSAHKWSQRRSHVKKAFVRIFQVSLPVLPVQRLLLFSDPCRAFDLSILLEASRRSAFQTEGIWHTQGCLLR